MGRLQIPIRLSAGVTWTEVSTETNLMDLVAAADRALLRAKESGRDRIETAEVG